jgi:protein SCO1/2
MVSLLLVALLTMLLWRPPAGVNGADDGGHAAGGDFTLGQFSLSSLKGRMVLLYFGYMSCPDICPTSLADIASVFRLLNDQQRDRIRGLFVTVDPGRDQREDLERYAAYFHPNILAVRGSREETDRAVARYGAFYRVVDNDSASGYQVDHSASIYLIDSEGKWVDSFDYGTPPARIAEAIQQLDEKL